MNGQWKFLDKNSLSQTLDFLKIDIFLLHANEPKKNHNKNPRHDVRLVRGVE